MTILDPLDVTPNSSFSSLQFQQEYLNVIVSSLLITLILANIGSIIPKIVERAPRNSFSFPSSRRFVLFLTRDDPLRLFLWCLGKYRFHCNKWNRNQQRVTYTYLLLPIFARLVLFATSIVAIAISIPTTSTFSGCQNADFRPVFDASSATISTSSMPFCVDVPLTTRIGTTRSILQYCSFQNEEELGSLLNLMGFTSVVRTSMEFSVTGRGQKVSLVVSLTWVQSTGQTSFSNLSSSINSQHALDVLKKGISTINSECQTRDFGSTNDSFAIEIQGCDFVPSDIMLQLNSFIMSALVIEKVEERQRRISNDGKQTLECPITIEQNQPFVNLLPLSLILTAVFILNMLVSHITSRSGNVLDSSYHIVKEIFGRDCLSNPLEQSQGMSLKENELPLKRVLRKRNGHVGFLEQYDDVEVEDFTTETLVCNSVGKLLMKQSGSYASK